MTDAFKLFEAPLKGRWLIEASAGTGKTFSLEHIVLRLVLENAVAIERILMVTFTNAATAELRERVRTLLRQTYGVVAAGQERGDIATVCGRSRDNGHDPEVLLQRALENFDEACVFTIHGFCKKMLTEFIFSRGGAYEIDYCADTGMAAVVVEEFLRKELPLLDDEDRVVVLTQWKCLEDVLKKIQANAGARPVKTWEGKAEMSSGLGALWEKFITEAPVRLEELEDRAAVKGYNSLLTDMLNLVNNDKATRSEISGRFDAVLIDEFQDTDTVQYAIFKKLFMQTGAGQPASVFFVGDPKQAIYSFRSAELMVYMQAKKEIEENFSDEGGVRTLDTNFRSSAPLLEAVNAYFSADGGDGKGSFLTSYIQYESLKPGAGVRPLLRKGKDGPEVVAPMTVWFNPEDLRGKVGEMRKLEAEWIADDIAGLLDGTVYIDKPSETGEPYRLLQPSDIVILVRSRDTAGELRPALLAKGIRSALDSRQDVFETEEAQEIAAILRAMVSPSDAGLLAAARSTRIFGRTLSELKDDPLAAGNDRQLLAKAAEKFARTGPAAAIALIAGERDLEKRVLSCRDGISVLMNYAHIGELLQKQFSRAKTPASLLRFMASPDPDNSDESERRVRSVTDADAVKIVTIHSSKGLEYPVVYLAGTEKDSRDKPVFWSKESGTAHVSPVKRDAGAAASDELIEEGVRLAYVAMTRASRRLVLSLFISPTGRHYTKNSACNPYVRALTAQRTPVTEDGVEAGYRAVINAIDKLCDCVFKRIEEGMEKNAERYRINPADFGLKGAAFTPAPDALFEFSREHGVNTEPVKARKVQSPVALPSVTVRPAWRRSSFTAIARGMGAAVGGEFEAEEAVLETREEAEPAQAVSQTAEAAGERSARTVLRGAQAGDWLHKVFERVMNAVAEDRPAILASLEKGLAASGIISAAVADERKEMLQEAATLAGSYVTNALHAELFDSERFGCVSGEKEKTVCILNDISPTSRICEMTFLMHVSNPNVSAQDVARIMTEAGYDMQSLRNEDLKGWLTGAIDMVFEFAGRYWVLDWKSNYLAETASQYTQESMKSEIDHKHYALQYVIYLLALKRHLKAVLNLSEEEVWQRIGGAIYVFVRGIEPDKPLDEEGRRNGIYLDCPRVAVDALDRLFAGK